MTKGKKNSNPLAERLKKLKEYSEASEKIYFSGPDTNVDKDSFRHYMDDTNLKLKVIVNEFDILVGVIHAFVEKYDDQFIKSMSDAFKKNKT